MKTRRVTLLSLPYDVLKEIFICLVRSSDGARNFAQATTSCKNIQELAFDEDVLRSVNFDNLGRSSNYGLYHHTDDEHILSSVKFDNFGRSSNYELFQHTDTLVTRCAQAGNPEAQAILGKIILMRSLKLSTIKTESVDLGASFDASLGSFLRHFMPPDKSNSSGATSRVPPGNLLHVDLVRLFLSRAKPCEFDTVMPCMENYIRHFFKVDCSQFLQVFAELVVAAKHAICLSAHAFRLIIRTAEKLAETLEEEQEPPFKEMELFDCEKLNLLIKYFNHAKTMLEKQMPQSPWILRYMFNVQHLLQMYEKFVSIYQQRRAQMICEFDVCCQREVQYW